MSKSSSPRRCCWRRCQTESAGPSYRCLDLEPPATVGNDVTGDRRPLIDVTKPRAHLKHETLEPLVLQLRERENVSVEVEILAVGVAAQVIVAGSDGGHGNWARPILPGMPMLLSDRSSQFIT